MIISLYDPATGEITSSITVRDAQQANAISANWVEGHYANDEFHVFRGSIQPLPEKPNNPDHLYQFDHATKQWILNEKITSAIRRGQRSALLQIVDRVNPVWFSGLSQEQQQQLRDYRQALLAVPQQPDFPVQVIWPSKPAWL